MASVRGVVFWMTLVACGSGGAQVEPRALGIPFSDSAQVARKRSVMPFPPELEPAAAAMHQGHNAMAAEELRDFITRATPSPGSDPTVTLQPDALSAMRLLAAVYIRMDALNPAIDLCRRISSADSLDAAPEVALGYLHFRRGQLDTAAVHYRMALQRNPADGEAYVGLGWIHLKRRELEAAMSMATAANERSPNDPVNAILVGRILTAQGFYKDAADSYQRAFRLAPSLRERYGILWQELMMRHKLSDG